MTTENKQLSGTQLSFKAGIKNFKTDGNDVTINLIADADKLDLNKLNQISQNDLAVDFMSVQTELLPEKAEEK